MVSYLEDDDWWSVNELERVRHAWQKNPRLVYFYNGRIDVSIEGKRLKHTITDNWNYWGWNNSLVSISRKLLSDNITHLSRLRIALDIFNFFVALSSHAPMLFTKECLTYYRVSQPLKSRFYDIWEDLLVIRKMILEHKSYDAFKRFSEMFAYKIFTAF